MLSDEIIEARANLVRKKLGIENTLAFDVYASLARLKEVAKTSSSDLELTRSWVQTKH